MKITCGIVQMNSGSNRNKNLDRVGKLVKNAADSGAEIVALPENFAFMREQGDERVNGESLDGPIISRVKDIARSESVFILAGSFPEKSTDPGKVYNTSVLVDPRGDIITTYRKIHLFDVNIPQGESHHESSRVIPGQEAVVADTSLGRMGLTICYDLRFGGLYQHLADLGALIIFFLAAFTEQTGKAHWEILIRSHAVENQVFMIAPAQHGTHPGNRSTYGHSMIVDPWGTILAEIPEGDGVALAELDLDKQSDIRKAMPVREHRVNSIYRSS
jgi:deaminated glutathione amidase